MGWVMRNRRRTLLLAIATAAVAAGVIVAIASASGNPRHASTPRARVARRRSKHHLAAHSSAAHGRGLSARAVAARYLGLSGTQLRAELHSGKTLAQIANATSGKSASGLVEALVSASQQARAASVRSRMTLMVDGVRQSTLRAAARYLGVSAAKLRGERRSGKSLAQIAAATSGKSATGLINALVAAREAEVKAAIGSDGLGSATADKYLSNLRRRVTRQVERTPHTAAKRHAEPAAAAR